MVLPHGEDVIATITDEYSAAELARLNQPLRKFCIYGGEHQAPHPVPTRDACLDLAESWFPDTEPCWQDCARRTPHSRLPRDATVTAGGQADLHSMVAAAKMRRSPDRTPHVP